MFNIVSHVAVSIVLILYLWSMRKTFALKPSARKLESLKGQTLVRYTSESVVLNETEVRLIPAQGLLANLSAGCKPVIWLFVGEPSDRQMASNRITSYDIQLKLSFDQLDKNYVLYREHDNVIGYTKEFEGFAHIVKSQHTKGIKFKILKTLILAKGLLELLLFFFCLVFLFDIVGYVLIGFFYVLIFTLKGIDKIHKHKARKLSENS
ncbi:hypothetical protein [Paenibacillus odorifer]|uniref:hypothetical protein n=1 Tax=Paenibacillus odorifer TaxID=189426 RepID=UPI00096EFEBE|nr:hypothetical protein [Paenibacillus odorifer]OMD66896.1 hypothetical protein BSK50_30430 [Paenibacillus odorifer]